MVLRLDPRFPVIWRSPSALQIGTHTGVMLDPVDPPTERAVTALVAGISESGLRMIANGIDPEALLDRLSPVLLRAEPRRPRIAVTGDGALAKEIARQLDEEHERVSADARPDLVIVVADHVLQPDDHGRWLRRDVPHLPIIVSEERIEVGPFVVPGSGACLYCVHLFRCEADPAWPALATQLARRAPAALTRTAIAEASAFAVRRSREEPERFGRVWSIDPRGGRLTEGRVAPHPECSCRALPENGSAPDAAPEAPPATTTETAVAVPA
tara:strand:+ start:27546 stop:28355 length:810 start_codon:yes stop_codon:yes gene_type:complete